MEKIYILKKQDLSQFKNIRIVKMLMVSHLMMDFSSDIRIGDDTVTVKLSSVPKFDYMENAGESLFLAVIPIADWCFQETLISQSPIDRVNSINKELTADELIMKSLSAFTSINIFADKNFGSANTFTSVVRKYADAVNQWKKTAYERETQYLNYAQIDYVCTAITEMLNRYKLYSAYKSGSLAEKCGIDEQMIRDWYVNRSSSTNDPIIPDSKVFGFKVIDNKIKENPFFILVITKCYTDTINDNLRYYCLRNLSGTDKVLCNVVFTAAKYL